MDKKDHDFMYYNVEKSKVLQESRIFNESHINSKGCKQVLLNVIFLCLEQKLSTSEATGVFFSITRLFQSSDSSLRLLVYLAIKELSLLATDVMMVTSSLTKGILKN